MNTKRPSAPLLPLLVAMVAMPAASAIAADAWPSRPIRLVVPFAPGGGSDVTGRIIGQKLSELMAQSVVVDNRPGAASMLGTDVVARAAGDGYTLLLADLALTINPAYFVKQPPADPVKAFTGVALIAETPYILMVNPAVPATTVKDFLALARAQPGKLNIGSSGNGGGLHLTLELFKLRAGLDLNHIPYKGGGPAVNDAVAGQIQGTFIGMGGSLPFVQTKRLRPLAVTSVKRSAALPEVPSMTELGVDVVVTNWYGIVAPSATPKAVVQRLYDEVGRAMAATDVRERLQATGLEPAAQAPGQFQRMIESELKRWRQTIRDARIPTE
ncbi:MAG: tripartite tricarboxylate transporter substrate binding protein [Betaproteobacteria bacterium]|jgi:tripartite-type tricarboxylate transporter receptor subunit TctC|nr:tripartite tricarboxylate transporter substrate binding protein [Betaproteobacteria bacterium]